MNRDVRKGQNEAWFRDLNERLERRALDNDANGESFAIVCECDREECSERIPIDLVAYEAVRTAAIHFIVAHGHADPSCERIVDSTDEYEVVEKRGEAALVAATENPRG